MADTSKDSRIKGGVKVGNLFISAVYRHGILGQVISSDAEEVCFLCKNISDQGCCRSLHHDTYLNILLIGNSLFIQFLFDLFDQGLCLSEFIDTGYKRNHDADVSKCTGS